MKKQRYISLLISFSFLINMALSLPNPLVQAEGGSVLTVKSNIVKDDFTDNVVNSRIVKTLGDGTLTAQEGRLVHTRTSTDVIPPNDMDAFRYYFTANKIGFPYSTLGIEFTAEKSDAAKDVWFILQDTKNNDVVSICWTKDGQVKVNPGNESDTVYEGLLTPGLVKFTVLLNPIFNKYSLWVNGIKVVAAASLSAPPSGGVSQIYSYMEKDNNATAYYDDFAVFIPVIPDEEVTLYDKEWLKEAMLTTEPLYAITNNLKLPSKGSNGSTITWSSSNPAVVSNDGIVTKPDYKDANVTMTAQFAFGSATTTKTFDLVVLKSNVELTVPIPQNGYLINDSFSSSELSANLTRVGVGGQTGTLSIVNNKLALARTSTISGESDGLRYYFKSDKSGVTEPVAMEFTIEKSNAAKEIWIKIQDPENRDAVAICWTKDGKITSYKGTSNTTIKSGLATTGPVKFTVLMNAALNTYSLWVDGQKLLTNEAFRYSARGGVSQLYAYLQNDQSHTVYFDDLKVYESVVPNTELVLYDQLWLTADKFTSQPLDGVTQALSFPTVGNYGSSITWGSSVPSVISNNGVVTKGKTATNVTLTATIAYNNNSVAKVFQVTVPASNDVKIPVPATDEYIAYDDFSDSILDTRIVKVGSDTGSLLTESDGKLTITRNQGSTNPNDGFRYYFNGNKTGIEDKITAVEFTVEKSDANKEFLFRVRNAADQDAVAATWMADGRVTAYKGGTNGYVKTGLTTKGPVKFTFLLNPFTKTYSMWIEEERVVENASFRVTVGGPAQLYVWAQGTNYYTYHVDDFKVYYPRIPDLEKLIYDQQWLTSEKFTAQPVTAITLGLNLPAVGENGSAITWKSSDTSAISESGTVARPTDYDKTVTLTATLTSGSEMKTKEFTLTVLKKSLSNEVPTIIGAPIFYNAGGSGNTQEYYFSANKSPFKGNYGVEFTVQRTSPAQELTFKLRGDDKNALQVNLENSNLNIFTRGIANGAPLWATFKSDITGNGPFRIHLLVSTELNKVSVWIDGEKVADSVYTTEHVPSINSLFFESQAAITTGDIKLYRPMIPSYDKVLMDNEYLEFPTLTYQDTNYIFESFELPTEGPFGSKITWSSSNPSVVSTTGKVTKPSSGSVAVKLTATIEAGTEKKIKNYDLTVVAAQEDELPEITEVIVDDRFDGLTADSGWDFDQTGGRIEQRLGRLEMSRFVNEGVTDGRRYFGEERETYKGVIGLEFTIRKSAAQDLHLRVTQGSYDYLALWWTAAGVMNVSYNTSVDSSATWYNVGTMPGLSVKVNALYNTEDGTFSLWLNNKRVLKDVYGRSVMARGVESLRVWLENERYYSIHVDNIKLYRGHMTTADRVAFDYNWLSLGKLLTEPNDSFTPNTIKANLNLMTEGYYGSDITWVSSNPALVGTDGKVNLPGTEYQEDPEVTLTATISAGVHQLKKKITFKVKRNLTNPNDIVEGDLNSLSLDRVSPENSQEIKMSLNFVGKGVYGSDILWTSSNTDVITKSGRVIRPKVGEGNVAVTAKALVTYGDTTKEKVFTFQVMADEAFTDPQHMTDIEFFGAWDESKSQWKTIGKLDYEYNDALKAVGEAVKLGEYSIAKEKLLDYMKDKDNKSSISLDRRDTNWVNMIADDHYHMSGNALYQGEFIAENQWKTIYANIKTNNISKGGTSSYSLQAWYNEASELQIFSVNHPNAALRPKMELTVNGKVKLYDAVDDVTIRSGAFKNTNYGGEEILKVKTFGEFLGNETYKAILKFEFPDIRESDQISSARLVLHSAVFPSFSGAKRILVNPHSTNSWTDSSATWNSFLGMIYSFNGLPGKNDWQSPENAEVEYRYQMARFGAFQEIALEYKVTSDETYAYKGLAIMADFINDMGGWLVSASPRVRGGYPRTLDTSIRLSNWFRSYDVYVDSAYMTPELNTAILKYIWDMSNSLVYHHAASGNWAQSEHMYLLQSSLLFPEFTDAIKSSKNWKQVATDFLEPMIYQSIKPDGSYVEATGGYNTGAYGLFRGFKSTMKEMGLPVSADYDTRLHKGAYYNALLFAPDGKAIQYGDEGYSVWSSRYQDIAEWYNDPELLYIDTLGKKGTAPKDWTSTHFPDGKISVMRSDWSKNSLYMFTNARGGGQHSHFDDNHVTVSAFGRILLSDSGIFSYTSTDPTTQWGKSTKGHNTVLVNKDGQTRSEPGRIDEWSAGKIYDYLNQTSFRNTDIVHNRKVTFIKPYMWIVSDVMLPVKTYETNDYKQLWHMLPGANLTVDAEKKIIKSNYSDGANIIVASADNDVVVEQEDGWYGRTTLQIEAAKYAYFGKSSVEGNATFDTVLVPYNNDPNAKVDVQRLSTGTKTDVSTAMKIVSTINNDTRIGYFYQSHETGEIPERSFGNYTTDAQVVYFDMDTSGKLRNIILKDGKFIREKDTGKYIINLASDAELSVERIGTRLVLTTADPAALVDALIRKDDIVNTLELNGNAITFGNEDEYVKAYGSGGAGEQVKDPGKGGIIPPKDSSTPGGSNPEGGTPGGSTPGGGTPGNGGSTQPKTTFDDIQSHWAKNEIEILARQGIVSGRKEDMFAPDDNITRAEFLALIQRALGEQASAYTGTFEDVSEKDWYAGSVQFGIDKGLIAVDANFRPNDSITRQEMAKMIVEAYKLQSDEQLPQEYTAGYDDIDRNAWSAAYIDMADYLGLIQGMGEGQFVPLANATRAQSAVIIKRFLDL